MMQTATSIKDVYLAELRKVQRPGINDLIAWLETTDFFTAPASTVYHNSCKFGLLAHSLNVYYSFKFDYVGLKSLPNYNVPDISEETIILVCLLHDLCKVNVYKESFRNVKKDDKWEKEFCYKREESLAMGHGAKSLHLIEKFIKLTDEEAQAIVDHMGAFDMSNYFQQGDISNAYTNNFLAFMLNRADMLATYFNENKNYKKKVENNANA